MSPNSLWHNEEYVYQKMIDMDGDGKADRVLADQVIPGQYWVQINTGTNSFGPLEKWEFAPAGASKYLQELDAELVSGHNAISVMLIDFDGDGKADRVTRDDSGGYTSFLVHFNNGLGFDEVQVWGNVLPPPGVTEELSSWCAPVGFNRDGRYADLVDIDGDGDLDRLMSSNEQEMKFYYQLNLGRSASTFGEIQEWSLSEVQGTLPVKWSRVLSSYYTDKYAIFIDMNNDGRIDRVSSSPSKPYNKWSIELQKSQTSENISFEQPITCAIRGEDEPSVGHYGRSQRSLKWRQYDNGYGSFKTLGGIWVDLVDINGDGKPDRVMYDPDKGDPGVFYVQMNKGGEIWDNKGMGNV